MADALENNLPRITKATEWLAGDYQRTKDSLKWYEEAYKTQSGKIKSLENSVNGYKGQIARLKKRIEELTPPPPMPPDSGAIQD